MRSTGYDGRCVSDFESCEQCKHYVDAAHQLYTLSLRNFATLEEAAEALVEISCFASTEVFGLVCTGIVISASVTVYKVATWFVTEALEELYCIKVGACEIE